MNEEQAIENTHSNYGLLLKRMGRNSEAEKQYKMALAGIFTFVYLFKKIGR